MGKILIVVALGAVALVLAAGVSTMFVEGEKARLLSNRLMRLRVLAQFLALLVIGAVAYFASGH